MKTFLILLSALILTGCGSFGFDVAGVMQGQKIGDNGAVAMSDKDVDFYENGKVSKIDATDIHVLETQIDTAETSVIFEKYYQMWSDFYADMAKVFKGMSDNK